MRRWAVVLILPLLWAGCGEDEGSSGLTTVKDRPEQTTQAPADPEAQLERDALAFAAAFSEGGKSACPFFADYEACPIYVGKPSSWQRSFAGAEVKRSRVQGSEAAVLFSNGEVVRFRLYGKRWQVTNVGGP